MKTPTFELLDCVCNTAANRIENTINQFQTNTGVLEKHISDPDTYYYRD